VLDSDTDCSTPTASDSSDTVSSSADEGTDGGSGWESDSDIEDSDTEQLRRPPARKAVAAAAHKAPAAAVPAAAAAAGPAAAAEGIEDTDTPLTVVQAMSGITKSCYATALSAMARFVQLCFPQLPQASHPSVHVVDLLPHHEGFLAYIKQATDAGDLVGHP
jgi:hypothetical protein